MATKRKRKMVSRHYQGQRSEREKFIDEKLGGDGNLVDSFIVNKLHPMGEEIHELRDNGLILIYNKNTGRLITKLIARKNQINRYYKNINKKLHCPQYSRRCFVIGKDIYVIKNGENTSARALEIDDKCGLLVEFENGEKTVLNSGEISIRLE